MSEPATVGSVGWMRCGTTKSGIITQVTSKMSPVKILITSTLKKFLKNQSTQSADGGGCLKFYRPLELIGIYVQIKKKKKKSHTGPRLAQATLFQR